MDSSEYKIDHVMHTYVLVNKNQHIGNIAYSIHLINYYSLYIIISDHSLYYPL